MRTLSVLAFAWAVLAGCSGSTPSPRSDGATESARPDAADAALDVDAAGDSSRADAPAADGPAGADAPRDTGDAVADTAGDRGEGSADADVVRPDGPPAPNALCAAPLALGPAKPTAHGNLDSGGAPAAACGAAPTPVLFYAVDVPAGHRLTAVAKATAGSRFWQPALSAVAACDATMCLGRSTAASGGGFRLDWTNDGASTAHVLVAVAGNVSVVGAEFDLGVSILDLHASCAQPIAVQNGTTILNLDLAGIAPATNTTCLADHGPALYYVATVLPRQELTVTASGRNSGLVSVNVAFRDSCARTCATPTSWGPASTVNTTDKPQTVLIEVTSPARMSGLFDLSFSLPPAPVQISVTPTSPLVTTEAGGMARFVVNLESQPAARVTVALASDRPSEGTVIPSALVFDATNWKVPQAAIVTGVDDQVGDGARRYTIVTAPAVSDDPLYSGLNAEDLPFTNLDDEPSLILDGADDVVTSEDGTPATFTLRLTAAPTGNVDVPVASSDTAEGTVGAAMLRFTPANWNVPQAVTVTGADDATADGPREYAITLGPLVSDDARYAGQTPASVVAHNRDDDFKAGTTTVQLPSDACGIAGTPNAYPAAIDALGRIYAVIYCDAQLFLLRSDDGGKTVSAPTLVATHVGGGFALAAARDGILYLAYEHRDRGFEVARSRDRGKTWSDHPFMPRVPDLLRIGAVRGTVLIVGDNPTPDGGYDGTAVLRSEDGGWTYEPLQVLTPQTQMMALGLAPDGKRAWLVDDSQSLFASGDAGKTWQTLGSVEPEAEENHCCYVFGAVNVFSIAKGHIGVARLTDAKNAAGFTGPAAAALAATIDDLDVMTIFGEDLQARRLRGSGANLASAKVDVPSPFFAAALTLSRHATAIVSLEGSHLSFTTVLW